MPSHSISETSTPSSERYGLLDEVHFCIARNKSGWYITEYSQGAAFKTYGPLEGPINRMDAMSYLVANHTLNQ